jgi:hypothetical protein
VRIIETESYQARTGVVWRATFFPGRGAFAAAAGGRARGRPAKREARPRDIFRRAEDWWARLREAASARSRPKRAKAELCEDRTRDRAENAQRRSIVGRYSGFDPWVAK